MGKRGAVMLIARSLLPGSALARDAEDDAKARNRANEIDTEHIFGFVEGGDIGKRGDLELEKETALRFGKRVGSYAAVSTLFDLTTASCRRRGMRRLPDAPWGNRSGSI